MEHVDSYSFGLDDAKPGTELIETYDLFDQENNPLKIVGNKEKGFAVVIGKTRLTDWMDNPDTVNNWVKSNEWKFKLDLMTTMIVNVLDKMQEDAKNIAKFGEPNPTANETDSTNPHDSND